MNIPTIKLKQHTPILHFQHYLVKSGATLRVTELKPKLDRYLNANYTIPAEWRINGTDAINYKLKITPSLPSEVYGSKPPMFFGQGKKPVLLPSNVEEEQSTLTIQFFCLNSDLINRLQSINWTDFFLSTNFGTRQSKGYGSFFPKDIPNPFVPADMIGKEIRIDKTDKEEQGTVYRVDSFFISHSPTWENVMNEISDVYKCLRSGINEGGIYFKSLMFAFAKDKGQWWDKRVIKELFFLKNLEEQRKKHNKRTDPDPLAEQPQVIPAQQYYPMFRDNLGLATDELWKEYAFKVKKKGPKGIARFKSPILFKPLHVGSQWYVFILHREIPKEFRDATFTIWKDETPLKFRTFNDFSMKAFLNYVFTIDNYRKYLSKDNDSKRANNILKHLENIKNNFKPIQ